MGNGTWIPLRPKATMLRLKASHGTGQVTEINPFPHAPKMISHHSLP